MTLEGLTVVMWLAALLAGTSLLLNQWRQIQAERQMKRVPIRIDDEQPRRRERF